MGTPTSNTMARREDARPSQTTSCSPNLKAAQVHSQEKLGHRLLPKSLESQSSVKKTLNKPKINKPLLLIAIGLCLLVETHASQGGEKCARCEQLQAENTKLRTERDNAIKSKNRNKDLSKKAEPMLRRHMAIIEEMRERIEKNNEVLQDQSDYIEKLEADLAKAKKSTDRIPNEEADERIKGFGEGSGVTIQTNVEVLESQSEHGARRVKHLKAKL